MVSANTKTATLFYKHRQSNYYWYHLPVAASCLTASFTYVRRIPLIASPSSFLSGRVSERVCWPQSTSPTHTRLMNPAQLASIQGEEGRAECLKADRLDGLTRHPKNGPIERYHMYTWRWKNGMKMSSLMNPEPSKNYEPGILLSFFHSSSPYFLVRINSRHLSSLYKFRFMLEFWNRINLPYLSVNPADGVMGVGEAVSLQLRTSLAK